MAVKAAVAKPAAKKVVAAKKPAAKPAAMKVGGASAAKPLGPTGS
ncbi:hypothetical protein [Sulfuriferula sp.]|nr:hypothetical protein [Sulfuriferula sp.]MDP2027366.1 hypothetical protein [Sulfuriferula sp.]